MVIGRPRGTDDLLPGRVEAWRLVESRAREYAGRAGFGEIRTPLFEFSELFERGVGEATDVVDKEMYSFLDRGDRRLTLRPEGTSPVARAYLDSGGTGSVRRYFYLQPNFRYERPQAGRYRQHHQFGSEILGAASPLADAEVILLATEFLGSWGLGDLEVGLNSIGCPSCRPGYRQALKEYYASHREELCPHCQVRYEKNPLRLLDCKEESCQGLVEGAPRSLDHLCDDCREHLDGLLTELDRLGLRYRLRSDIVRGLDYYTRTVFEIQSPSLGAQATLCGGGRYDGLVEALGGPSTPGVGFGLGLERLLLVLGQTGYSLPGEQTPEVLVVASDPLPLARDLRREGFRVELDLQGRSLKAQLKGAGRRGIPWVVIAGSEEAERGKVSLRRMETGEQAEYAPEELAAILRRGGFAT